MEKWVISAKKADFYEISRKFGVDPVIARLIRNREQITDEEIDRYLHGKLTGLHSWKLLKGMDTALDILIHKIREGKKIRIIGDYDIDGVCSTCILFLGLRRLGNTKNLGLKALIQANQLDPGKISVYHIGFVTGPCLNAGGRLQTAKLALALLLAKDQKEAWELAAELKALNDQRKDMTQQGVDEAAAQVEQLYMNDKVLVIFLPDCHESLAGIVAGSIRERYNKPVFVLTHSEEGAKGSGRSIEAYHMFHGLVEVQDLLSKFGGHPMAAGFSLPLEHVEEFRRRLNENARLTEEDFIPKVWIDIAQPFENVGEELIGELERLEPFGQGNEKPQFALKDLFIRSARVMGKNRNVVKLMLVNERGTALDGVVFTDGDLFLEEMGDKK